MTTIANPIPTPSSPAPDILRCASMELVVTDLAKSREFYVDILGLHVTEEDDEVIYLRSFEEFIHHNLILRQGEQAAVAAFSYRVRSPEDVDRAEAYFQEMGCRTERRTDGFVKGKGTRSESRTRSDSRTSFSTRPRTWNACTCATTFTALANSCGSITSTR